jgi:hypothetical protein
VWVLLRASKIRYDYFKDFVMIRYLLLLLMVILIPSTHLHAQPTRTINCATDSACKITAAMALSPSGECEIQINSDPLVEMIIARLNVTGPNQKVFVFEVTPPIGYVFGSFPFSFYKVAEGSGTTKGGPYGIGGTFTFGPHNPGAKQVLIGVKGDGSKAWFYLRTNRGGSEKEEFFFGVAAASKGDPSKACIVDPKVVNGE